MLTINLLEIPVVIYNFNVNGKIRQNDTDIRKLMICNKMHHPKPEQFVLIYPELKVIED